MQIRKRVIRKDRQTQALVKEWLICGRVVYRKTLDTEYIPGHVIICLTCLRDTGLWVSKFAPFDENGVKL